MSGLGGVFSELKRRNVVRMAGLYVAAGWLVVEIAGTLLPMFDAPAWIARAAVIVIAIGFLPALLFAWVFEFTPDGLKREDEIPAEASITHHTARRMDIALIVVVVALIGYIGVDKLVLSPKRDAALVAATDEKSTRQAVAIPVPERSIAVLPFVNRSTDKDQEFFSDGISEDMLNLLAKVPQLRVISRSSSFSFKGKDVPLKEIAQTLGVAYILEGSVQRAGDTLRISAQLVDARRDQNVWSQRWDRPFGDVFKIQDEIAGAVVGQLKLKLLGKAQEIDPESYALYLQARQLERQGTRAGFEQAIPLLQQVLAKVPGYAPAWQQLGLIYVNQGGYGLRPAAEGLRLARDAVNKALAADPDYAPAYASLGVFEATYSGDLAAAAEHYAHALALDPGSASSLNSASNFAGRLGRLDLAIALRKASLARDPVKGGGYTNLGMTYYFARRPDEAIASFGTALRLSPDLISGQSFLATALLQKGDAQAALAAAQKEPDEGYRLIALAIVYHALGRKADSDAVLAQLIGKYEQDAAFNIAYVLAYRGEVDRAFEWLDKAQAYEDPGLADIAPQPLFDNLRKDPRWLPLLRKLGKAPEQLEKIKFNPTLPDDAGAAP